jgi:dephospho-CoA kinase
LKKIYVGMTGLSGSGKDAFASLLGALIAARGIDFYLFKLSDEIKTDLNKEGMSDSIITRHLLILRGNQLRATFGKGVLAERIMSQIDRYIPKDDKSSVTLITGIRTPEEVSVFRNELKENFILAAIETDDKTRMTRKLTRKQYNGDEQPLIDEQADQDIGILKCIKLSDIQIINNGPLEALENAANGFFLQHLSPLLV